MSERRMGSVDTIWLNMDRPNNLMVIVSLMFLEKAPSWERVVSVIQDRLVDRYPVFRQRPVTRRWGLGQPRWADDPDFVLDRHFRRVTLAPPGDEATLRRHLDSRLHLPLSREHPLWEAELIEGFGDGAVLMCRFHHALADGIALTDVLLSMTDASPDEAASPSERYTSAKSPQGTPDARHAIELHGTPVDLLDLARTAVGTSIALARKGVSTVLGAPRLLRPRLAADALTRAAKTGQVVESLIASQTPDSPLGGTPWPRKHAAWSQAFPLAALKQVGRMADATLNDVLMSAVAGAMFRYQADHGADPVDLVTMVPVNVRPPGEPLPRELGNRFALVFFTFPSSFGAPIARLAETKRRMDWLKGSPEAMLTFSLISAIGRAPSRIERPVVDYFANKAVGVTTNVMGPKQARYLAGSEITGILGWVPGSGKHTVGVCIFTYADTVRVGFMVDAESVPDADALVTAFEQVLGELIGLVSAA
ncbi:MAG: wax ester/triacylglycerol synthase family O-acyltransferase [Nocardioidaceae bacterium]